MTRYVLAEFLKVFLAALASLTLLFLVVGLGKEATDEGLGPKQVLYLIPYILPDSLRFTLPATTLFAVSMVFGRMSGANEIVAMKALGINPKVIFWPVLVLSFCLSLTAVWLNDVAVSWGREGIERVVLSAAEEIAYGMLRTNKSYSSGKLSIVVRDVIDHRLIQPTITFSAGNDVPKATLRADEAELILDDTRDVLILRSKNAVIDMEGKLTINEPGSTDKVIPLRDGSRMQSNNNHPSFMPLAKIVDEIKHDTQSLQATESELATLAVTQMLNGDFAGLTSEEWTVRTNALAESRSRITRLKTEPYRRWANGFSCLCFAMVGVGMAVRMRNADLLTSFFFCFLPILVVYYPLLMFGVEQAKSGRMPPATVWLGNLILLAWGTWLIRKAIQR